MILDVRSSAAAWTARWHRSCIVILVRQSVGVDARDTIRAIRHGRGSCAVDNIGGRAASIRAAALLNHRSGGQSTGPVVSCRPRLLARSGARMPSTSFSASRQHGLLRTLHACQRAPMLISGSDSSACSPSRTGPAHGREQCVCDEQRRDMPAGSTSPASSWRCARRHDADCGHHAEFMPMCWPISTALRRSSRARGCVHQGREPSHA